MKGEKRERGGDEEERQTGQTEQQKPANAVCSG